MKELTIDWIKDNRLLILEAITGSKAYGLSTATSDTDVRGVFILPKRMFYSLEYVGQVSNESNDIVYYELKRFMELLSRNNPNILEMLGIPENCLIQKDKIMDRLMPEMFLSKLCQKTFANYAFTQVKKAYSLEKKIVNPLDKEKRSVLDFCFVYDNKEAVPLKPFLASKGLIQNNIGLASIPHLRDCYNLFYSETIPYSGVMRKEESNDVCLSSIPKNEQPIGLLYFNRDAYSVYCKKYKEYWEWVAKRNDARYLSTMAHGKNYDAKNMMHVFRLLLMAKEIAVEGQIKVLRSDRDFLLSIKEGHYEYDELLEKAQQLKDELPLLYQNAQLQEEPDVEKINELLIEMREEYYKLNN